MVNCGHEFGNAFHKGFFGNPSALTNSSAEDIDTQEYFFFAGPNLEENEGTKMFNSMFGMLSKGNLAGIQDMIDDAKTRLQDAS